MLEDYYRSKTYVRIIIGKNIRGLLSAKIYVRGLIIGKNIRGLLSVKHKSEDHYR